MSSQRVEIVNQGGGGTAGADVYKGPWNPATNVPALASSGVGGVKGDYYTCSIDGNTTIDGISTWYVGDKIVNNGTLWEKIEGQANDVRSFNGRYGDVTPAASDYDASQIDNDSSVSGATVKDALNTLAGSGGAVSSVFGRSAAVVAVSGDYDASQINTSATGVSVQDKLDELDKQILVNTTYTVKTSGGDFTSIHDALNFLDPYWISPDAVVTIEVFDGTFTSTTTVPITHDHGDRIKIKGQTPLTTTIVSYVSVSGSTGNYAAIIQVADTSNIVVGDFVMLKSATGTGEYLSIMGHWEVTDVDTGNSRITLKHKYRKATFPTMTLTGGTVIKFPSVLVFNGCDAFQLNGGLGGFENFSMVGNLTSFDAFNINHRNVQYYAKNPVKLCSTAGNLGIANFWHGINNTAIADVYTYNTAISGSTSFGVAVLQGAKLTGSGNICSGGSDDGFNFSSANALISTNYSLGNAGAGFRAYQGSKITVTSSQAIGNAGSGFECGLSSSFYANGSMTALNNAQHGHYAYDSSSFYATTISATGNGASAGYYGVYSYNNSTIDASTITAATNTQGDIRAANQGLIKATTYSGTPTYSPARDIVGNAGGLIKYTATYTPTEVDVTGFTNNLSSADTDVQKALDTIDNLTLGGAIPQRDKYYVDGLYGNDTTATGNLDKPFQTIQACLYAIGHTVDANDYYRKIELNIARHPLLSEYTENLVFPHRWISVVAPGVRITGNITKLCSVARKYAVDSSTVRPCISFYGRPNADARQNHPKIRDGLQIAGDIRTMAQVQSIASIQGNGTTVTVTVTSDGFAYNAPVGQYINISGTTAYNGIKLIASRTGTQTFTFLDAGTGLESTGSFVECNVSGVASTTKDAVYSNCKVDGTITEDDGTVNAPSLTTGACVWYSYYSSFNAIEGRGISLYRIEKTEFLLAIIVGSLSSVLDTLFTTDVTCATFTSAKFVNTVTAPSGINWTVSSASQVVTVDLITTLYLDRFVKWLSNKPTLYQIQIPNQIISTTDLNIYVSTTGDDAFGAGTIGSPYFSIHRAIKDIPEYSTGASFSILCADGTYDYSGLDDIIINKKMVRDVNNLATFKIVAQGGINAYTIVDSGTFAALTDLDSNIHTDASKTWTVNEHSGRFLRIKTMNSGSLPNNGDGTYYTYRIIPILRNGVDYLETGFVSLGSSQDIADYDIVDHSVVLNLGTKNFTITDDSYGSLNLMGVKLVTTGYYQVAAEATIRGAHSGYWAGCYNTCLDIKRYEANEGYLIASYLKVTTGYCDINVMDGVVFTTSYNTAGVAKISASGDMRDCVFQNTAVNKDIEMIYLNNEMNDFISITGRIKFINIKYGIQAGNCNVVAKFYFDTVDWLVDASYPSNKVISSTSPSSIEFKNEPTLGRVTNDGITVTENYLDIERNFNATCFQPPIFPGRFKLTDDGGFAHQMTNKTGAASVEGMVVSENDKTTITESGDTANQLSAWVLFGVRQYNCHADGGGVGLGELYWTLEDIAGTRTVALYKENSHSNLVSIGSRVGDGVIDLTAQNDSNITGRVTVAYTVDDTDIGNSLTVPIDCSFIPCPAGTYSTIGVVYDEGIADGEQCHIVKSGAGFVLLEDGQGCIRGETAIISPVADGRVRSTSAITPSSVGFFEETKEAGTNVIARISIHLDDSVNITPAADQIPTTETGMYVQDKLNQYDSLLTKDSIAFRVAGTTITTGHKAWKQMGYDGVFTGWSVACDNDAGNIVFSVKKASNVAYPVASAIDGSESPTLVAQRKDSNLTISSWTTSFVKGDWIEFLITSTSVLQECNLTLYTQRF
jgi:hypothetical protein